MKQILTVATRLGSCYYIIRHSFQIACWVGGKKVGDKSKYSWQRKADSEATRELAPTDLHDGYRLKLRINKNTHRILVPKDEENETYVHIYIEPTDWPQDK